MPRRFRRKGKRGHRRRKRGRKRGRKLNRVIRSYRPKRERFGTAHVNRAPYPYTLKAKLPYFDIVRVANTSVVEYSEYRFNLNSIWDPDATNVGHTARGTSFYGGLFSRYLVRGVMIELSFYIADATAAADAAINTLCGYVVGPEGIQNAYADGWDLMEEERDKYKDYHYITRTASMSSSSATPSTIQQNGRWQKGAGVFRRFIDLQKMAKDYQYTAVADLDDTSTWPKDYTSDTNASPPALLTLMLFAQSLPQGGNLTPSVNLPTVYCRARLQYYVDFMGPKRAPDDDTDQAQNNSTATGGTGGIYHPGPVFGHTGVGFQS